MNHTWRAIWSMLTSGRKRQGPRRAGSRTRLALEYLEDRVLLATGIAHPNFMPMNGGQRFAGPGTTGFTPTQIKQAYGINQITFNNGTVIGDGSGTTIAIVDAYREPNIVNDLH